MLAPDLFRFILNKYAKTHTEGETFRMLFALRHHPCTRFELHMMLGVLPVWVLKALRNPSLGFVCRLLDHRHQLPNTVYPVERWKMVAQKLKSSPEKICVVLQSDTLFAVMANAITAHPSSEPSCARRKLVVRFFKNGEDGWKEIITAPELTHHKKWKGFYPFTHRKNLKACELLLQQCWKNPVAEQRDVDTGTDFVTFVNSLLGNEVTFVCYSAYTYPDHLYLPASLEEQSLRRSV
jgi:hypothetical protein